MSQTPDMPVSLPALVAQRAAASPATTILRRKARGIWHAMTWEQLAEQMRRIGAGLREVGFGPGDIACIIAETHAETASIDLAVQTCGGCSVVIYGDAEATRIEQILCATASRAVFVENEERLDKILSIRDRCPALSRIVILDMKGLRDFSDPHCISLAAFAKADADYDWSEAARNVSGDQPAMILVGRHDPIASGGHDTGSVGQVLRQSDLMNLLATIRGRLGLTPRDERLALLGMADPVERIWGLYAALDSGCISNYLESSDTGFENLRELQPTVLGADAEAWTHLYAHTTQAAQGATAVQKHLYHWAIRSRRRGGLRAWVAALLVLGAVRRELGLRRLRLAYMGGEGVSPAVLDWAHGLGLRIQRIESAEATASASDTQADRIMQKAPA